MSAKIARELNETGSNPQSIPGIIPGEDINGEREENGNISSTALQLVITLNIQYIFLIFFYEVINIYIYAFILHMCSYPS